MSDLHEVQFTWPSVEHNSVIVTGTFDEWSSSIHLVKNESGFHGSIKIPWDTTIYYKYVVDSNWVCEITSPTQTDNAGNVNNVYTSPPKPVEAVGAPDVATVTNGAVPATENPEPPAPAVADPPSEAKKSDAAPSEGTTVTGEDQTAAQEGVTFSQLASDFVDTVAARDGTSSALGYVASALGAAIQSQIGMDPINNAKIAIETPKPDGEFNIPEPPAAETSPVAVPEDSPIAPVVPIAIVPVNAGENNTSSSETPAVAITPSVAPEGPVTGLMTEPEASLAPDSELVERPSTHMPLLSAVPPPVDTPQTPAPPVGVPSVSEIPAETVTASESKTSETLAPSEPPVNPTPEPATTAASVSEVPAKAGSVEPAVATVAESEKPSTNGTAPTPTSAVVSSSTPAVSPAASAPATPAKNAHAFPSSETESVSSSTNNSPSKFGTVGSRQIRQSIFGKFKGLFHSDKEEKKKKK